MKKFFIAGLMLCLIFSATKVQAADLFTGHPVVGVWEFENKAAVSKELFDMSGGESINTTHTWISDFIQTVLKSTPELKDRFIVVNYGRLKKIVEDKKWKNDGMVDTTDENYRQILSVQFFVDGALTGISTKPTTNADVEHKIFGGIKAEKRTVIANITLNFTDADNAEIIVGVDGVGKSSVGHAELKINEKGEEFYETDNADSSDNPTPEEGKSTNILQHTVKIGTEQYSLVQVQNAVRKAVIDAVQNKKYGLVAVLNGTAKGGRFYK